MQHRQEKHQAEELRREIESILDHTKSVHVKLPAELHSEFRVFGLRKKLSMQEMLVEMVRLIVDGDGPMHGKMDNLAKRKKENKLRKLSKDDAENIYDYISSTRREGT